MSGGIDLSELREYLSKDVAASATETVAAMKLPMGFSTDLATGIVVAVQSSDNNHALWKALGAIVKTVYKTRAAFEAEEASIKVVIQNALPESERKVLSKDALPNPKDTSEAANATRHLRKQVQTKVSKYAKRIGDYAFEKVDLTGCKIDEAALARQKAKRRA